VLCLSLRGSYARTCARASVLEAGRWQSCWSSVSGAWMARSPYMSHGMTQPASLNETPLHLSRKLITANADDGRYTHRHPPTHTRTHAAHGVQVCHPDEWAVLARNDVWTKTGSKALRGLVFNSRGSAERVLYMVRRSKDTA
jgi:hypothetical protein